MDLQRAPQVLSLIIPNRHSSHNLFNSKLKFSSRSLDKEADDFRRLVPRSGLLFSLTKRGDSQLQSSCSTCSWVTTGFTNLLHIFGKLYGKSTERCTTLKVRKLEQNVQSALPQWHITGLTLRFVITAS